MNETLMFMGLEVVVNPFISDYTRIKRTWKERLFTKPWQPLKVYKRVEDRKVYYNGQAIYMSYEIRAMLLKDLRPSMQFVDCGTKGVT